MVNDVTRRTSSPGVTLANYSSKDGNYQGRLAHMDNGQGLTSDLFQVKDKQGNSYDVLSMEGPANDQTRQAMDQASREFLSPEDKARTESGQKELAGDKKPGEQGGQEGAKTPDSFMDTLKSLAQNMFKNNPTMMNAFNDAIKALTGGGGAEAGQGAPGGDGGSPGPQLASNDGGGDTSAPGNDVGGSEGPGNDVGDSEAPGNDIGSSEAPDNTEETDSTPPIAPAAPGEEAADPSQSDITGSSNPFAPTPLRPQILSA